MYPFTAMYRADKLIAGTGIDKVKGSLLLLIIYSQCNRLMHDGTNTMPMNAIPYKSYLLKLA
jgi:hypothetical protein